ncbi:MAG: hypothetical protein IPM17_19150 [Verrucomicrobia bacterium]|nr:hypothetical protein [Verrucomicrobiota bacterium]
MAGIAGFDNWDFEQGLFGWEASGDAFDEQPTFGEAYLRSALGAGEILRNVGGDYWDTPVSVGHHGDFWIGTGQARPEGAPIMEDPIQLALLDAGTGTLTSPQFRIERPFISFLIGGNLRQPLPPVDAPRVELLVRPIGPEERFLFNQTYPEVEGGFHVVQRAYVPGYRPELLRREVFEVAAFRGRQARIRIVDATRMGHINVDDFRFLETDPRPGLIAVPRMVVYLDPTQPPESHPEPQADWSGLVYLDPDAPVWGFADTHTHPASYLGFGGKLIHGACGGPAGVSLSSCEENHGWGGANACFPLVGACAPAMLMEQFTGSFGHRTGGYQYGFDGWPNVLEQGVHQQMYIDWIRRAWQGGLRLMVALAVHNRLLADLNYNDGLLQDDLSVVHRQIQAIRQLVARTDFMELALTPRQARAIIHRGKLAVVLGMEVDRPLLHDETIEPNDGLIVNNVRHAYEVLGIRHMFPVHFADNPYGGFAMNNSLWIYNSWWVDFHRYPAATSPQLRGFTDPIEWRFVAQGGLQVGAFFLGVAAFPPAPADYPAVGGHINARGLQPAGRVLIREMMKRGMVIDADHMSLVMKREVFDLARAQRYPLISGHSGFTELSLRGEETSDMGKRPSEADLTPTFARELVLLDGMVAPITLAKDLRAYGTKVPNDAPGSAKSWAQTYLRAVDYFNRRNVGLSTDFGLVHGAGPRFGMKAMFVLKGDAARTNLLVGALAAQSNGVRYADPLRDYRASRFEGPNELKLIDVYDGPVFSGVYDKEEKEFWEAIALHKTGLDPDRAFSPPPRNQRILQFARGLFALNDGLLADMLRRPVVPILGDWDGHEVRIRAAYHVRHSATRPLPGDVHPRVREIYHKMLPIWQRWVAMEGNNRPLHRCKMNCMLDGDPNKPYVKEWDINLDGLAHYGLLPDFIQDAKNSGLDRRDLRPLFRSAEDYIRLWERCEQNRLRD